MGNKKDYNYYDMFVKMVDYSCQAAEMLHDVLTNFDADKLHDKITEMHNLEHGADMCKHDMMNKLVREFITPIEREDIMELAQELDEVTDNIEDVLLRVYMYNITAIRPEALEFSNVIVSCCKALKKAMEDFHNFRKSTTVQTSIIEINRLEEVGDKLYTESVRRLYVNCKDPIEIIAWTETLDRLEKCCDACEHAANVVESVIMKNS
ncbi:DUF47 family protein [Hydrogenoanaerobacterium sp.]|uniref:DUF47 domain-containing protein n=1 Tax=Hydrogenoanaerobacterium sp. TaxID=2953763 RepID=UPI0028A011EF|nr:DUF47 family protein [Hydrogenoanaerobacterium sp.]